jgi:DNA-binding MarR family transcriptional regulator
MNKKTRVDKTLLLFVIIQRTVQAINRKMSPLIREDGLTVGQWDTLNVLFKNGSMTVNGLIEKLLTSSGNIDVVINNLIKRGDIIKTVDKEDKRIRIIEITDKGRDIVKRSVPKHKKTLHTIFDVLDESEKDQLKFLLKKLGKSIN